MTPNKETKLNCDETEVSQNIKKDGKLTQWSCSISLNKEEEQEKESFKINTIFDQMKTSKGKYLKFI